MGIRLRVYEARRWSLRWKRDAVVQADTPEGNERLTLTYYACSSQERVTHSSMV